MTVNGITGNVLSDEWYTNQETVNLAIGLLNPKPNSMILCPFDSQNSLFVKTLESLEHTVVHSINDFVDGEFRLCDYIITNPPFSIKDHVIRKAFEYGVKTVLVLPIDAMGGVRRHQLFAHYGYPSVYIPARRIAYYDEQWKLRKGTSFHSIIMTLNDKESRLDWGKL
jgi:hypothetical protein